MSDALLNLLTNAYSRAAYADQVLGPVAKKTGHSKRDIADAVLPA